MKTEFRIVGIKGNIPFDEPADKPFWPPLEFLRFVKDDDGCISGVTYLIDLGRGYGFDNGKKKLHLS